MMSPFPYQLQRWLALLGFLIVTFFAPALSLFIGMPGSWYQGLHKPVWTPPSWVFGPTWTLLYTLMAIGAWIVWERVGFARALHLYFMQLALNAAWTPIFFGAHALGWALIEIALLWLTILATLLAFRRVNQMAAWLFFPYLIWVFFAMTLNFALWRQNSF